MDNIDYIYILSAIVFSAFILYQESHYTVKEEEQVVITQFGKAAGEAKTVPGVYFKIPFIQEANCFPNKTHRHENSLEIQTADKKSIKLDTRAFWRIDDALQFYNRVVWFHAAENTVWSHIHQAEREVVATTKINELVVKPGDLATENTECNPTVLRRIHQAAQPLLQALGILLVRLEIRITELS